MAALPAADRGRCRNAIARYLSRLNESTGAFNKADLLAAVNAADDWVDANSAAYNTALPAAFRNGATAGQKSLLLAVVVLIRRNSSLARQLFGEID